MIRVLIADDHGIVRGGLKALLDGASDIEVVGEATNGRQAVQVAAQLQPTVVVMDIGMPILNGLEAAAQIIQNNDRIGIIILSMYTDESYLLRSVEIGVKGYLLKDNADEDIEEAIRKVARGRPFFSPRVTQLLLENHMRLLKDHGVKDSYDILTEREREILQLLAEGRSNKEAATLLNISPHTVEAHRANLMEKLGLHNVAEIVLYAVRKGIITA